MQPQHVHAVAAFGNKKKMDQFQVVSYSRKATSYFIAICDYIALRREASFGIRV